MKQTRDVLAEASRFLTSIRTSGRAETPRGPAEVDVVGELSVTVTSTSGERVGLRGDRFALAVSSIPDIDCETGTISVMGDELEGAVALGGRRDRLELQGPCRIHYPRLDDERGVERERGCYYLPTTLPAAVRIVGTIRRVEKGVPSGDLEVSVACAAGAGEAFTALILALDFELLPLRPSFENCHAGLSVNRRRLSIQPVGFRTSTSDPSPSASTAAAQLATASAVWGKSCIGFDINPTELITNATLKTSSDQAAIRASYTHPDPNTIEIFFVQNPLSASGGGNAGAIGVASQKIVVAEPNGGNPVLVAHELGHALGLLHPPSSDGGSVMAPTGSAMVPGTELVSHFMCQSISQPALQTLITSCCLSHDTGDHFVRDFPEDTGAEPSDPLPPGRTRYSMSNVWNRLASSPGTFGGNGPDHQHPVRFQSDGTTPFTNHLFARVEQRGPMLVRNAAVKFYLKHPGSGGGAANIDLLGQVSVPATLPANVSLPWQVPTGTPNHSCVFAVVRTDAEPEDDPTTLTWQQMEALSRADNDWAQRNLSVGNTSGSGNIAYGAPIAILIPEELRRPKIQISVDARGARGLAGVEVAFGDDEFRTVPVGRSVTLDAAGSSPYLPIEVRVHWKRRLRRGSIYSVGLDPSLDGVHLTGYAWTWKVPQRPSEVVLSTLDVLRAALHDLVSILDLDAACRFLGRIDELTSTGCITSGLLGEAVREHWDLVDDLVSALDGVEHARAFGVRRVAGELRDSDLRDSMDLLRSLAERLQMVAWAEVST